MPYRKRYRRRRFYKKRAPPSRWSIYSNAGKQLWKDVKYLKNLINTEFKYLDTSAETGVDDSGTLILLNGMTKGDSINTREGRTLRIKSVQLHININMNTSATRTRLKWALVIDKQVNGAAPNISDIYDNVLLNFRNLNNRKRFVILKQGLVNTNDDFPERDKSYYKRLNFKTIYNAGNAGSIADINTNSFYLLLLSDENLNTPTINYTARIRFIDN